jgi:RNA polymerase-binding protein DksA
MNQPDLERLRTNLLDMRERLSGEIARMNENVLTVERAVGEHDRGVSESVEKEVLLEMAEAGLCEQVREALQRIDLGTYGICQECGRRISKQRLAAVPYARCCVKCERIRERA